MPVSFAQAIRGQLIRKPRKNICHRRNIHKINRHALDSNVLREKVFWLHGTCPRLAQNDRHALDSSAPREKALGYTAYAHERQSPKRDERLIIFASGQKFGSKHRTSAESCVPVSTVVSQCSFLSDAQIAGVLLADYIPYHLRPRPAMRLCMPRRMGVYRFLLC